MASFPAKIGWKRLRKSPTSSVIQNSKKMAKKLKKIKKYHYGFIPSQNRLEKAEKQGK